MQVPGRGLLRGFWRSAGVGHGRVDGFPGGVLLQFWSQAPAPVPSLTLRAAEPAPIASPRNDAGLARRLACSAPVVGQAGTAMATRLSSCWWASGEPPIGRVLMMDAATQRADVLTFAVGTESVARADVAAIVVGGGGESAWVASPSLT